MIKQPCVGDGELHRLWLRCCKLNFAILCPSHHKNLSNMNLDYEKLITVVFFNQLSWLMGIIFLINQIWIFLLIQQILLSIEDLHKIHTVKLCYSEVLRPNGFTLLYPYNKFVIMTVANSHYTCFPSTGNNFC